MDSWIRALKIFCVVAGVVLVLGTATLIWLLVQRKDAQQVAAPLPAPPGSILELLLPEGLHIEHTAFDGRHVVLMLRGPDQQQYLALVNPATGERLSLLRVTSEEP